MTTFITHKSHPELFTNSSYDGHYYLQRYELHLQLFEGKNALPLDACVVNYEYYSVKRYLFTQALFNSLRGFRPSYKLDAKKNKSKILTFIEQVHQVCPEALKELTLWACYLKWDSSIYIYDKLIELGYVNLNAHFDYDLSIQHLPDSLGHSPLMFMGDAKTVEYLMSHYTIDFNLIHGGLQVYSQYTDKINEYYGTNKRIKEDLKKKMSQLNGLNLFQQTVKLKQSRKMAVVKKFMGQTSLEEQEKFSLEDLLREKSVAKQYNSFVKAIYSNNQEVLSHINSPKLSSMLNYRKGMSKMNVLS